MEKQCCVQYQLNHCGCTDNSNLVCLHFLIVKNAYPHKQNTTLEIPTFMGALGPRPPGLGGPLGPQNKKRFKQKCLRFQFKGSLLCKTSKINIFRLTQFWGVPWGPGVTLDKKTTLNKNVLKFSSRCGPFYAKKPNSMFLATPI